MPSTDAWTTRSPSPPFTCNNYAATASYSAPSGSAAPCSASRLHTPTPPPSPLRRRPAPCPRPGARPPHRDCPIPRRHGPAPPAGSCRGEAWTEEEHKKFPLGLNKLGKGDWCGISRNYVISRTPTQLASHAQKYFNRQTNMHKRKRRSSLFDMVIDDLTIFTGRSGYVMSGLWITGGIGFAVVLLVSKIFFPKKKERYTDLDYLFKRYQILTVILYVLLTVFIIFFSSCASRHGTVPLSGRIFEREDRDDCTQGYIDNLQCDRRH